MSLYIEKEYKKYYFLLGKCQHSFPLTTNISQMVTEQSNRMSYQVGDLCRCFTKLGPLPAHCKVFQYLQHMVQMASCDLSHIIISQTVYQRYQNIFVIRMWGILTSPLTQNIKFTFNSGDWKYNEDNHVEFHHIVYHTSVVLRPSLCYDTDLSTVVSYPKLRFNIHG